MTEFCYVILTVGLLIVKFKVPNKVNLKFENQIWLKYPRIIVVKGMTVGEEEVITLLATLRILVFKGQQKSVILIL